MRKLNHILSWDNYYIDGYGIFLLILGLFHPWVFILSGIYFFIMRKKLKIFFVLFFSFIILLLYSIISLYNVPQSIQGEARVISIKENLYSETVTIKYKHLKFNMQAANDQYQLGDIIYVHAEVNSYRFETIPFGFNQKKYYLSQGIHGYLDVFEASTLSHRFSIFSYREKLLDDLSKHSSNAYISALIFGEKAFSGEQSDLFKDLGIMYLLTISGMHVYMLFIFIDKILFYLSVSERTRHIIKITIFTVLLYLNLFSIGVLRLFIIYLLQIPNQKYRLMYAKLDLTTFTFLLMLVTNIHLIYHTGFLMTYLILNFLYLMEFRYRGYDGYFKKLMITSIIFLVVLPFNRVVSPMMILVLPFVIGAVTGPLFLGAIITMLIPEFNRVMELMIHFFETSIHYLNNRNISIHLPALTTFQIFIYFAIIIIIFRSSKIFELFFRTIVLSVFFLGIILYTQKVEKVVFLDVGQGDSTVIQYLGCVIVIDAFTNTESYLVNQGIYTIDYLILTHSDFDHTKEAASIIENINVKKLVLSYYDDKYEFYKGEKLYVKSGDQIRCGDLIIEVFGPIRQYQLPNNNSIVLQTKIDDLIFLFTGDIEQEAEFDLINHYGYHLKSDVLKIAHHGSSTSSTIDFIRYVQPSISIISLGYDNKFGFPNPFVLERLLQYQSIIYRSDIHGSIIYTPSKKKQKWGLVLPF